MPFLETSWLQPPVMLRDRINLLSEQVIPGRPYFIVGLKLIKMRDFSCTGPDSLLHVCARRVLAWALPTAKEPNLKLPVIFVPCSKLPFWFHFLSVPTILPLSSHPKRTSLVLPWCLLFPGTYEVDFNFVPLFLHLNRPWFLTLPFKRSAVLPRVMYAYDQSQHLVAEARGSKVWGYPELYFKVKTNSGSFK